MRIRQLFFILAGVWITAGATAQELKTARVSQAVLPSSVAYQGYIEAVTETAIAAQVSGEILAVQVRAGDPVRAGQVLLQIDATHAKQQQAAMTAQVAALRAELH